MYYTGFDIAPGPGKIGRATSLDGINWQRDTINNPVLSGTLGQWDEGGVMMPRCLYTDNLIHMWYTGFNNNERQVGYATSPNGINWTKHISNPVLTKGSTGSWDGSYVEAGTVMVLEDSVFQMWYDGSREPTPTNLWRIGIATAPFVPVPVELTSFTVTANGKEVIRRLGKAIDPDTDFRYEAELKIDRKELAEHMMLVDLARNDLGRVCDFGSVRVKDLMVIERYSHVMHIVSQVEGRLSDKHTTYDLMRATFPAGTLSGAPKIRAMQINSELEQTTRGPYGGCVGYFSLNGNLDCCITIRTALVKDDRVFVQAGGGWVTDSDPESEYQETMNKSKAMDFST